MLKKNELKNLIYIQENNQCNEQTIKGLFRAIVQPILEDSPECVVLLRLEDKSIKDQNSIIQRLGFSSADVYDFSRTSLSEKFEHVLKDDEMWGHTEFVYVLSQRFGAILIYDFEDAEMEGFASYYLLYNSKSLADVFALINQNSTKDLSNYSEQWHPDRRENELMNSSIRKLVENLNQTNQEVMISELEKEQIVKSEKAASQLEFITAKSGYTAHEMKNLLSICNLYTNIISKHSDKITYKDEETEKSVTNAHACICKSLQMCVNMLLEFRSMKNAEIKEYNLKNLIDCAIDLSRVYADNKAVIESNVDENLKVLADENKFLSVLINLIKNAVESIEEKGKITITTEVVEEIVKIIVSNNGKPLSEDMQNKIFEEGFTTKKEGNGLGLKICQKTMEEQYGSLKLLKSDNTSTDFEVSLLKG